MVRLVFLTNIQQQKSVILKSLRLLDMILKVVVILNMNGKCPVTHFLQTAVSV